MSGQTRVDQINVDAVLADLRRCQHQHQQQATHPANMQMLDDQLLQLFPGADHPELPADSLIEIPERWVPRQPPGYSPESLIMCQVDAKAHGLNLPFILAAVIGPMGPEDTMEQLIVQWWVPPICQIGTRQGRARDTVDLFGAWRSMSLLTMREAADFDMPSVLVDRSKVLMGLLDLVDSKLTYSDLDKLIDEHKIDITGLTWTQTKNGNAFRLHRLMR